MNPISFKRHRFPPDVIRYAVWLYFRFTMSFRDVEELLAEWGIEVSYETIRCWTIKFGPQIAANLKARRPAPSPRWHLDEMVCSVGGKRMYLWRVVDDEGEILDMAMRPYRDAWTATEFLADLMIGQPVFPERIVTDGLKSYVGAAKRLRIGHLHHQGRLVDNNRAENSHLPIRRRERKMQKFKSQGCFTEIIRYQTRLFVRLGRAAAVLGRLMPQSLYRDPEGLLSALSSSELTIM